jgi:FkbM family methyltransferase
VLRAFARSLTYRLLTRDLRSARVLVAARAGRSGGTVFLRRLAPHPFHVRGFATDAVAVRDAFWHEWDRPRRESRVLVDLGAHIGSVSAMFAVRCPQACIWAVEMASDNARICRLNLSPWMNRFTLVEAAVWHQEDVMLHYDADQPSAWHVAATGRPTPTITLNRLVLETGPIDYLKMDIEGAEAVVLTHATAWAQQVRMIRVEIHQPYNVDKCIEDLMALGFTARIDRSHEFAVVGRR